MKKIRVTADDQYLKDFSEDIGRLVSIFASKGLQITHMQACLLWKAHSESWAAGWLDMDTESDEEVFNLVREFFEVIE